MGDGLGLYFKDLYPNFNGVDTSNLATPSTNDQDALGEDVTIAEKVTMGESSKKNILIAIVILFALVIFFGIGK